MKWLLRGTLLLAAFSVPRPIAAQSQDEPVDQSFGEDLVVTEVLLDVLVTDKRDRVIVGLSTDDFVVSEGGEVVELTSVTFYSSRRLVESSERLASQDVNVDMVPRDRYFIFFVQEQRNTSAARPSLFHRQLEAGRQFGDWLMEPAQAADHAAVVSFSHGLKIHQDFTVDREALMQAIEGAARGRNPTKIPPSRRLDVEGDPAALAVLPAGKELRRASKDIYHALRLLADAVASVPGRKNLVFLGRGFGDISTFGTYKPEPSKLNPTLQELNDANVAVYTLDIAPHEVRDNLQLSLRDLAASTGGRFFHDLTSFTQPMDKISDLTSGYYLLSYESRRPEGEAGYQRVRVGTRNPEFRIQARQGYLYDTRQQP